jgi:hypothetical protein
LPEEVLILGWTGWDGTTFNVTYSLSGTDLSRVYKVNNAVQSNTVVGNNISSCNNVYATGKLTFSITATVGNESETRIYEVKPRPGT